MATTNFYLVDARGAHPAAGGVLALAVFLVGALLPRRRGARVLPAAVGLAVARTAEQAVQSPGVDLVLSALGVTMFLWLLSMTAAADPAAPAGLLLGVCLDVGVHGAAGTVDLSWQPGGIAVLVVASLATVLVVAAAVDPPAAGGGGGWQAIVIGPWLVLGSVVYGNVAYAGSVTGLASPAAWLVAAAGAAAAVATTLAGRATKAGLTAGVLVLVATAVSGLAVGPGVAAALVLGQAALGVVLAKGLREARAGPALPVGLLLVVVLLFLYYGSYEFDLGFRSEVVLLAAAALAALSAAPRRVRPANRGSGFPVIVAVGLLGAPLVAMIAQQPPGYASPDQVTELRVMTYNLHQGFDTSGRLDLEALARVIEAERPDVVALQEVSRGWLVDSASDMLAWLSLRLDLPYVTGPTADRQWGNAVLSRYPVVDARNRSLPPSDLPLRRGYLDVRIDTGNGQLRVLATHLHHVDGEENVRLRQVEALLEAWADSPRTVILGDLNATPESTPMARLLAAGLVDAGSSDGISRFTSPADDPRRTIDYVLLTPDLVPVDISVPPTTASDHLPVAVTVRG